MRTMLKLAMTSILLLSGVVGVFAQELTLEEQCWQQSGFFG